MLQAISDICLIFICDHEKAKPVQLPPQRPRRHFPYVVSRQVGATVRQKPEKSAAKTKNLSGNSRTYVNTKKVDRNGVVWLRCSDGWVNCFTDGGQRLFQPVLEADSPVAIKIISTSFADPPSPSFWESLFFFMSKQLVYSYCAL